MNAAPTTPATADKYAQALDGRDPLASMRKGPKRTKKLLKGRSEKELAWRPAPGKWSVKEVLAHHADGEIILGSRLRFVAAMDDAPLPGYDQDLFVTRLGVEKVKSKALLAAWESARALNVALLDRLPKGAFARTGLHAERGPESIERMVAMYAGHDCLHEAQIERTLAEYDAARRARKLERKAAKVAKKSSQGAAQSAPKGADKRRKDASEPKALKKADKQLEAILAAR
ncbi:MAG: DinB family protein [Planctomycetes bacterium]|nr:DinB family protein [Planctomycetota bacterium]